MKLIMIHNTIIIANAIKQDVKEISIYSSGNMIYIPSYNYPHIEKPKGLMPESDNFKRFLPFSYDIINLERR